MLVFGVAFDIKLVICHGFIDMIIASQARAQQKHLHPDTNSDAQPPLVFPCSVWGLLSHPRGVTGPIPELPLCYFQGARTPGTTPGNFRGGLPPLRTPQEFSGELPPPGTPPGIPIV